MIKRFQARNDLEMIDQVKNWYKNNEPIIIDSELESDYDTFMRLRSIDMEIEYI